MSKLNFPEVSARLLAAVVIPVIAIAAVSVPMVAGWNGGTPASTSSLNAGAQSDLLLTETPSATLTATLTVTTTSTRHLADGHRHVRHSRSYRHRRAKGQHLPPHRLHK
jgi:hypothetical protein